MEPEIPLVLVGFQRVRILLDDPLIRRSERSSNICNLSLHPFNTTRI